MPPKNIENIQQHLCEVEAKLPELAKMTFQHRATAVKGADIAPPQRSILDILKRSFKITDQTREPGSFDDFDSREEFSLKETEEGLLGHEETILLAIDHETKIKPAQLGLSFFAPDNEKKHLMFNWKARNGKTLSLQGSMFDSMENNGVSFLLDYGNKKFYWGHSNSPINNSFAFNNSEELAAELKDRQFEIEESSIKLAKVEYDPEKKEIAFVVEGLRGSNILTEFHLPSEIKELSSQ